MSDTSTDAANLRELASRYAAASRKLMEAASILDGNSEKHVSHLNRVVDYLKEHGPSRTKDIIRACDISNLTQVLTRHEDVFQKIEHGVWALKGENGE